VKSKCIKCGKIFEWNYWIKGIDVEMFEISTCCPFCNQELMIQAIPIKEVKIKKKADYIG